MIARGCRSSSRLSENFSTLGRHWPLLLCSQLPSTSANAGRSRKNCSVSTNTGVSPLILERGLIRSLRVELVAAVVALVAARAVVPADRAGALDVAVGQRPPGGRGDGAERGLREDVAVVVQAGEHLLRHRVVVAGRGPGEQVVGHVQAEQVLGDHPVVAVGQLARRDALLVGLHLDRRAVLVGPADHQHLVARHPLVPGEHVARQAEAGDVADVAGAVGVGPGRRGKDVTAVADMAPAYRRGPGVDLHGYPPGRAKRRAGLVGSTVPPPGPPGLGQASSGWL